MAKRSKGAVSPKVPAVLVSLKLSLDPETVKALRLLAVHRGCSVSQAVAALVAESPTRLVLQERPRVLGSPAAPGPPAAQGDTGPFGLVGRGDVEVA